MGKKGSKAKQVNPLDAIIDDLGKKLAANGLDSSRQANPLLAQNRQGSERKEVDEDPKSFISDFVYDEETNLVSIKSRPDGRQSRVHPSLTNFGSFNWKGKPESTTTDIEAISKKMPEGMENLQDMLFTASQEVKKAYTESLFGMENTASEKQDKSIKPKSQKQKQRQNSKPIQKPSHTAEEEQYALSLYMDSLTDLQERLNKVNQTQRDNDPTDSRLRRFYENLREWPEEMTSTEMASLASRYDEMTMKDDRWLMKDVVIQGLLDVQPDPRQADSEIGERKAWRLDTIKDRATWIAEARLDKVWADSVIWNEDWAPVESAKSQTGEEGPTAAEYKPEFYGVDPTSATDGARNPPYHPSGPSISGILEKYDTQLQDDPQGIKDTADTAVNPDLDKPWSLDTFVIPGVEWKNKAKEVKLHLSTRHMNRVGYRADQAIDFSGRTIEIGDTEDDGRSNVDQPLNEEGNHPWVSGPAWTKIPPAKRIYEEIVKASQGITQQSVGCGSTLRDHIARLATGAYDLTLDDVDVTPALSEEETYFKNLREQTIGSIMELSAGFASEWEGGQHEIVGKMEEIQVDEELKEEDRIFLRSWLSICTRSTDPEVYRDHAFQAMGLHRRLDGVWTSLQDARGEDMLASEGIKNFESDVVEEKDLFKKELRTHGVKGDLTSFDGLVNDLKRRRREINMEEEATRRAEEEAEEAERRKTELKKDNVETRLGTTEIRNDQTDNRGWTEITHQPDPPVSPSAGNTSCSGSHGDRPRKPPTGFTKVHVARNRMQAGPSTSPKPRLVPSSLPTTSAKDGRSWADVVNGMTNDLEKSDKRQFVKLGRNGFTRPPHDPCLSSQVWSLGKFSEVHDDGPHNGQEEPRPLGMTIKDEALRYLGIPHPANFNNPQILDEDETLAEEDENSILEPREEGQTWHPESPATPPLPIAADEEEEIGSTLEDPTDTAVNSPSGGSETNSATEVSDSPHAMTKLQGEDVQMIIDEITNKSLASSSAPPSSTRKGPKRSNSRPMKRNSSSNQSGSTRHGVSNQYPGKVWRPSYYLHAMDITPVYAHYPNNQASPYHSRSQSVLSRQSYQHVSTTSVLATSTEYSVLGGGVVRQVTTTTCQQPRTAIVNDLTAYHGSGFQYGGSMVGQTAYNPVMANQGLGYQDQGHYAGYRPWPGQVSTSRSNANSGKPSWRWYSTKSRRSQPSSVKKANWTNGEMCETPTQLSSPSLSSVPTTTSVLKDVDGDDLLVNHKMEEEDSDGINGVDAGEPSVDGDRDENAIDEGDLVGNEVGSFFRKNRSMSLPSEYSTWR